MTLPDSIRNFFPYPKTRPGQSILINEINNTLESRGNNLLIEAANGIGKTITTLSALLPIIKKNNLLLIYATRTHTQIDRVIEELERINNMGQVNVVGLTLKGRTEMCLNEEVNRGSITEISELCGQLRKKGECEYFNNLKNFTTDIRTGRGDELIEIGKNNKICPYYLAKRLLKNTDVIITTYNYLIHPFIRQIFFNDIEKLISECIIVFDEGHNIIDVARDAGTNKITILSIERALNELIGILLEDDENIIRILEEFKTYIQMMEMTRDPKEGEEIEIGVRNSMVKKLFSTIPIEQQKSILVRMIELGIKVKEVMLENNKLPRSSLYKVSSFMHFLYNSLEKPQYIYEMVISKQGEYKKTAFSIKTIDIRPILKELFQARNVLVLSGTLEPIQAFIDICGFPNTTQRRVLPSPFAFENIAIYGLEGINLKYENRTESNYSFLMRCCLEVAKNTPFNTGVFCSSYGVLNGLLKQGLKNQLEKEGIEFFREYRDTNSKLNEKMIEKFKDLPNQNRKGFLIGVSGGRNSEGVDFPGKEMSSVIVIGVPLAMISYSTNKMIKYFKELYGDERGLDYAYYIPALRKANQAAGRPVRRLQDRGLIVFLDERFFYKKYYRFLSDWIRDRVIKIDKYEGLLGLAVKNFYKN
ncbi:MAG: hypothetical protein EU551_02030 [Promethearchaeota archaeon]|nr:MAG: hypothetical protein EU551_02030 [Candidatus Lokiarchaeota archaeon]